MAKNKRGKTGGGKGKGKGKTESPRQQRPQQPTWKSNFVKASGAYPPPDDLDQPTFTLRDAARNSEHPPSFFSNSTLSLRHKTMEFVKGEEYIQQDLSKLPRHLSDFMEFNPVEEEQADPTALDEDDSQDEEEVEDEEEEEEEEEEDEDEDEDEESDKSMPEALGKPPRLDLRKPQINPSNARQRPPSPSDSDDEVVFVGRNHIKEQHKPQSLSSANAPNFNHPITPPQASDEPIQESVPEVWEDISDEPVPASKLSRMLQQPVGLNDPLRKSKGRTLPGRRKQSRRSRPTKASAASDDSMMQDLLDDYVENMRANGELPEEPDQPVPAISVNAKSNGWTSDAIQDFDEMSTSQEILEAVQSILSKRERPGGVQYLVVWMGQSVDEARWIPMSSLTMPGAAALIETFEQEEKRIEQYADHDSDSDDESEDDVKIKWTSDSEDSDLEEELDDYLDEEDLIERRIARMTDEHIARLLQKQESLGIHSDQLQIFDDADQSDEVTSKKKRGKNRRNRQEQALFNAEEALMLGGDDYGDFDVMDFERPSLKNTKNAPPDYLETLSDEDMAQTLREAWATDRKKKRAKKLEREELRAQGLLGKKNKLKPDLKARYTEGMSTDQLFDEIEDFLLNGQQEELSLPPMAKHERKVIHDVSRPFGLKSKSQGNGKQRFTILYKTSRTTQLDIDDVDLTRLKRQLTRRFLPRMDAKKKDSGRPKGRPGEASYRDGEIVGAGAAELGVENRGRAMLEKMGWSSGTALGAVNNQGILMPIQHVVKNSKAGLG